MKDILNVEVKGIGMKLSCDRKTFESMQIGKTTGASFIKNIKDYKKENGLISVEMDGIKLTCDEKTFESMIGNYEKMNDKKDYRELDYFATSIEDAVEELEKYKKLGERASINFKGHKLFSDTATVESAYLEVFGESKEYFDMVAEIEKAQFNNKMEKHMASIPRLSMEWMIQGRSILDEKYWGKWDEIVPIRLHMKSMGKELGCCLDIVKELNEGCSMDKAKGILDSQGHSGASEMLVRNMVAELCDRGEAFDAILRRNERKSSLNDRLKIASCRAHSVNEKKVIVNNGIMRL